MKTCTVDNCLNKSRSLGMCKKHVTRYWRTGSVELKSTRKPEVTYWGSHGRLRRDRGPASGYDCTDCGMQAKEWSYMHGSERELISPEGHAYSCDTSDYEPRCMSCHAIYDEKVNNQYTSNMAS